MTDVNPNTFTGSNQGTAGGYAPLTLIESAKMDADLTQILNDLNYHVTQLQNIWDKLDTIDTNAVDTLTAAEIVASINASSQIIDIENLAATVAELSDVNNYINTHRITTTPSAMHTAVSISGYSGTYDYTPSSIATSPSSMSVELENIRTMIDRIIGGTTWVQTPADTILNIDSRVDSLELPVVQNLGIRTTTVTTAASATADYTILCDATSGTFSVTLPQASTVTGHIFNIKKIDSSTNSITIDPYSAELIDGSSTYAVTLQYESVTIQSSGTGWVII